MAKGTTHANDVLKLIFNATAIANLADNAATSPLTNIYVALHTADPGAGGTQATSELAYTGYARVAVPRTTATPGWTASTAGSTSPTQVISFPAGTGGTGTATYFSVGVAASGATRILYSGPISPSLATGNGVTPQLSTATVVTEA